jgi:hypothetical protein
MMAVPVSAELRLILGPRTTYAALARVADRGSPWSAVRRPLLVAIVLGASGAIAATGHVTPSLLLSMTACWSVVVVLQMAIALSLIARPAQRTVGLARALDLFFASHAPWSLWLLAAAAWAPSAGGRPLWPLLAAAVVPLALTPPMIAAFFREVLEMDPRHAAARTAAHQAITWTLFLVLAGSAVQIWPRVLEWLA